VAVSIPEVFWVLVGALGVALLVFSVLALHC
jgi:hypothetical protein